MNAKPPIPSSVPTLGGSDSGDLRPAPQSLTDIERELNERLAALGLPVATLGGGGAAGGRFTQYLKTAADSGAATQVLDLRELRSALTQQIRVAEIKEQVVAIIGDWVACARRTGGLPDPLEFELRAASLLLPYCREYIPDFPTDATSAEFAMDLDIQSIIQAEMGKTPDRLLSPEQIDTCAVEIIQTLLEHPLLPRKEADRIEIDLHTTTLRDKNGTSVYTPTDARFLQALIEEQNLLNREGELGLLAMLVSGRKWNKIDSESLFAAAIEYTLQALAKKRGVPEIVLRNQGRDHPVAYILCEFIHHHMSLSLEEIVRFIEEFIGVARDLLPLEPEAFVAGVRREYIPRLKRIFLDLIHDSIFRFLQTFEREFLDSSRSERSKIFFLKRVGDFCELAFYCYEAVRNLESPSGEVYARERLSEGTEHFSLRNNIPLAEGMDFFNRKNTLAELLVVAMKHRREQHFPTHNGGRQSGPLSMASVEERRTAWRYLMGVLMSDLLSCLDLLRRTFDHNYARGRESSYDYYLQWKDRVLEWGGSYARLLLGRAATDVESYRIESLARRQIEEDLAFVNMHLPSVFREGGQEIGLDAIPRTRQPEDIIKENFLCFFRNLHTALVSGAAQPKDEPPVDAGRGRTAPLTFDDLRKRVFLARSDLPLGIYTLESLASYLSPETHDRAVLLQALETGLELPLKAYTAEEITALRGFLKQVQQRLSLLVLLSDDERMSFNQRIGEALRELQAREPIRLASYLLALRELDDPRLSDERVLEEWKNAETSIRRMLEIEVSLVLTRSRADLRLLSEEYARWLDTTPLPSESARRRTFVQRRRDVQRTAERGPLRKAVLRTLLRLIRRVQIVASVRDWSPPETYILEDLLGTETSPMRVRELEAVLSNYPPDQLNSIVEKLGVTLNQRFDETHQSAYYAPEERDNLGSRLKRLKRLQARTWWERTRDRAMQRLLRMGMRPLQAVFGVDDEG